MTIYLIVSILMIAVSTFFFFESIILSSISIVPIALIGISILQAIIFKSQEKEGWGLAKDSTYVTYEVDYEAVKLSMRYHSFTKLSIIPMLCIFIIYFDTVFKIMIPICVYFLSFLPVRLLVKYNQK